MIVTERFQLDAGVRAALRAMTPRFGFGQLGEVVYARTYSRTMADGRQERWPDTVIRVVEGVGSIRKDWQVRHRLPWDEAAWQDHLRRMAFAMFEHRFLPPGRGLWAMGTDYVYERGGMALNNCAFVDVGILSRDAAWTMNGLMAGVGVGFSTIDYRGELRHPAGDALTFVVPDAREGWVESLRRLINSYEEGSSPVHFDYSLIRPAGSPIRGFGGTASGYQPLCQLHERARSYLDAHVAGQTSRTRLVADIFNAIGACVVAGNVRRCLPQGTLVHTARGAVPIEQIVVGDEVVTLGERGRVSNTFTQGVQPTVVINHQFGQLECTANHRVAVFDSLDGWIFKKAGELVAGDRLVFDSVGFDGVSTGLPEARYNIASHDTVSHRIVTPDLDPEMAWLIGMIQGDGYAFVPGEDAKTPNGYASIACADDYPAILERANAAIQRFAVPTTIKQGDGRYKKVEVYSDKLARYLQQYVKQPKTTLRVPEWIRNGVVPIRAAYLAGVMDADGCPQNRPLLLAASVYREFLNDLRLVCASLGIAAKIQLNRPSQGTWQDLWCLTVVGAENRDAIERLIAPYSGKWRDKRASRRSAGGFTFPTTMVRRKYTGQQIAPNRNQTTDRITRCFGQEFAGKPVAVLTVEPSGREVETFDIEVEGIHQFTAEGFVVHNSAEISIGSPHDQEFLDLKNYGTPEHPGPAYDRMDIGWLSNNTVRLAEHEDFKRLPELAERIRLNGEPGVMNLINVQKYGRYADEAPDRATGTNPCAEIALEDKEICCLVEVFPTRCPTDADYFEALELAQIYAHTASLLATDSPETNAVVARNHRMGQSLSGIADWYETRGATDIVTLQRQGYRLVQAVNERLAAAAGVPKSVRLTTVKPSGTVSQLAGVSPGMHYPVYTRFLRRVRIAADSKLVPLLHDAGVPSEPDVYSANTLVFEFPVATTARRTQRDLSMWQKGMMVASLQRHWADNMVSNTITFDPATEGHQIEDFLAGIVPFTKSISMLPDTDAGAYLQMPYEKIDQAEYERRAGAMRAIDWSRFGGSDGEDSLFCASCEA